MQVLCLSSALDIPMSQHTRLRGLASSRHAVLAFLKKMLIWKLGQRSRFTDGSTVKHYMSDLRRSQKTRERLV